MFFRHGIEKVPFSRDSLENISFEPSRHPSAFDELPYRYWRTDLNNITPPNILFRLGGESVHLLLIYQVVARHELTTDIPLSSYCGKQP